MASEARHRFGLLVTKSPTDFRVAHHTPRDEDGRHVNNQFQPTVAQVMWTGFMLKPLNLFDQTPLYP